MIEKDGKKYDLEDKTLKFAGAVRNFIRDLKFSTSNSEDGKQVIRSSGSVGANYIEANEAVSTKDCILRIKICKKEIKESRYWLTLIDCGGISELEKKHDQLIQESTELMKIFASILYNLENKSLS